MRLPAKDPQEIKLVRFVYATEIERGVTITSVVMSITLAAGVDAGFAAVLNGAALIDNTTFDVLQRVALGLADCDYELRCVATDSSGLKHLIAATLPVRALH